MCPCSSTKLRINADPGPASVVFVNNYLNTRGGSERVMFDEIAQLESASIKTSLFGRRDSDAPGSVADELLPVMVDFNTVGGWRRLRAARDLIRNPDVHQRFTKFLQQVRPSIVHCHNIYGGLTTVILDVCRREGIPSLLTLHDYKLACPSYMMLRDGKPCQQCLGGNFYHCALSRCHKCSFTASAVYTVESYYNQILRKYHQARFLIAPSRFLLGRIHSHGLPSEKLVLLPNGVDVERIQPSPDDAGYALYVGRLSIEKGLRTLLRSMRSAPTELRIVGDGPERAALESEAQQLGLRHVTFHGYKSGADLERIICKAAMIVMPSEWYENAPMSLLEAMAYGKPVVAARIGGIPELVEDGASGILFEPGNSAELAAAMRRLAANPEQRRAMGRAGRERVEKKFSLRLHAQRLTALYSDAIRG